MSGRGFTLIELLAVVVILGMVASASVMSLSSANDEAQMRWIAFRWRELDGKARIIAQTQGCEVTLINDSIEHVLRLKCSDSQGDFFGYVEYPIDMTVEFTTDREKQMIRFDRRGVSEDYTFTVTRGTSIRSWRISGLTGWIDRFRGDES